MKCSPLSTSTLLTSEGISCIKDGGLVVRIEATHAPFPATAVPSSTATTSFRVDLEAELFPGTVWRLAATGYKSSEASASIDLSSWHGCHVRFRCVVVRLAPLPSWVAVFQTGYFGLAKE